MENKLVGMVDDLLSSSIQQADNKESKLVLLSKNYNDATTQRQLIHEQINTAYNHSVIVKAFNEKRAMDISDVQKAEKMPALIIGSGPSLDDNIEKMRDWQGGIFCTSSQALTLMHFGIEPTHIVALDPFCTYEEIEGVDWSKTRTKLVCHPGCWPTLIEKWPNEMIFYIEDDRKPNSFYTTVQKFMYTWREERGKGIRDPIFHFYIRTQMAIFACSPAMQILIADKLGYGNCFLCGCDFGYTNNKERFTEYSVDKASAELKWIKTEHPFIKNESTVYSDNGIPTHPIHIYYKKNFFSAWRLSKQTLYTTDKGIITEIPYVPFDKALKNGKNYQKQSWDFVIRTTERYLARTGAFVVEGAAGVVFCETDTKGKELDQINGFVIKMGRSWKCKKCNNVFIADDDKNYIHEQCPICHNSECIEKMYDIDVEKNLTKFKHLMVYVNDCNASKHTGSAATQLGKTR